MEFDRKGVGESYCLWLGSGAGQGHLAALTFPEQKTQQRLRAWGGLRDSGAGGSQATEGQVSALRRVVLCAAWGVPRSQTNT